MLYSPLVGVTSIVFKLVSLKTLMLNFCEFDMNGRKSKNEYRTTLISKYLR